MTDIHIPPAALEAGARTAYETYWRIQAEAVGMNPADLEPWTYHNDAEQEEWRTHARAAFLAMIEAWPGMAHYRGGWEPVIHNNRKPHLILPLMENPDAEA